MIPIPFFHAPSIDFSPTAHFRMPFSCAPEANRGNENKRAHGIHSKSRLLNTRRLTVPLTAEHHPHALSSMLPHRTSRSISVR
jgi:hypothetical protein